MLQLARAFGLRVIGSAGTAAGRDVVLANGAHDAVDHSAADHMDRVKELTGAIMRAVRTARERLRGRPCDRGAWARAQSPS